MNKDLHNLPKISASLMCVDWLNAEKQIQVLNQEKIDFLHIDVIDGRYAPDFTMGTSIINCFREIFNGPFDYHLMVEEPSRIFDTFDIRKGDSFCIHLECCRNLHRDLITLRNLGANVGVALSPATHISALDYILEDLDYVLIMTVDPGYKGQSLVPQAIDKIKDLKEVILQRGLDVKISVDGNVSLINIPKMVANGGDILVSGSSGMFKKDEPLEKSIMKFKEALKEGINARTYI
jgi:ribulose-phosphate 3-epimerase|tara:strand:+ start:593 stop:1300 length:708 start_codon:yes stop_codon:yes gene_type:complete